MSWFAAVLWAVLTGVAAGINPDWQSVLTRQYSEEKQTHAKPAANAHTSGAPSGEPVPQVHVDVPQREGEFPSGVAFAGGPHHPRTEPRREDEGRRRRRTRSAATTAEQVCARCKAALDKDLEPVDVAALARTQEAEHDEPTPTDNTLLKDPELVSEREDPAPTCEPNASLVDPQPRRKGPISGRLTTSLATRGALTRMVERASGNQPTGG